MELDISQDAHNLAKLDKDFARLIQDIGIPKQRRREATFSTLVHIIISQQISLLAADSLWKKLNTQTDPISPKTIVELGEGGLREIGFSKTKAISALNLSNKMISGAFDLNAMLTMDDKTAQNYITNLTGFGEWSASIYLIFCLGRKNIWPIGDIALQEATRHLKRIRTRPTRTQMDKIGRHWCPWRSAAAHLLWHYYATIVKNWNMEKIDGFQ